jgi:hypothetical protein
MADMLEAAKWWPSFVDQVSSDFMSVPTSQTSGTFLSEIIEYRKDFQQTENKFSDVLHFTRQVSKTALASATELERQGCLSCEARDALFELMVLFSNCTLLLPADFGSWCSLAVTPQHCDILDQSIQKCTLDTASVRSVAYDRSDVWSEFFSKTPFSDLTFHHLLDRTSVLYKRYLSQVPGREALHQVICNPAIPPGLLSGLLQSAPSSLLLAPNRAAVEALLFSNPVVLSFPQIFASFSAEEQQRILKATTSVRCVPSMEMVSTWWKFRLTKTGPLPTSWMSPADLPPIESKVLPVLVQLYDDWMLSLSELIDTANAVSS